jgi:hypothetical protein
MNRTRTTRGALQLVIKGKDLCHDPEQDALAGYWKTPRKEKRVAQN